METRGAALVTEIVWGNIAVRRQKKLKWEGPDLRFTNDETANKMLHGQYREGWGLA